LVRAVES